MVTILAASTPIIAHTANASRLVAALVEDGHRVLWYCAERFTDQVRRCGAVPMPGSPAALGEDDTSWSDPGGFRALRQVRALYRDQVVGRVAAQLTELSRIIAAESVEVVLSDTLMVSAGIATELAGLPWVTFGDGPLLHWDQNTPPFGTGLPPMPGPAGRHRNRNVQRVIDRWLFAPAVDELNRVRRRLGLAEVASLREASLSADLHLQGCTPSLEYPRDPMPEHLHFVGPLGPLAGSAPPLPRSLRRENRHRPLAVVTQGTMRPEPRELIIPACAALVAEGFDVLVTGTEDSGWNRLGERVLTMHRVDYAEAFDHAELFVTNGGYTGVTMAVAAGVPVLQCGASEEKADIGARVRWAGVGASIPMQRPPVWLLRWSVRRMLGSAAMTERCAALAAESRSHDAGTLGLRLITALVEGRRHAG